MVKSRVKLAKFLPDNWTGVYISHRDVTMSFDLWFTRNGLGMITSAENAQIIPMSSSNIRMGGTQWWHSSQINHVLPFELRFPLMVAKRERLLLKKFSELTTTAIYIIYIDITCYHDM
jgi:hypothetical protein